MKGLIVGILAGILAGCVVMPPSVSERGKCGDRPTQAELQKAVDTYVSKVNWKDEKSVRIRNVVAGECTAAQIGRWGDGSVRMIGWEVNFEVNATNGFGGYTGYQRRRILLTPADGMVHFETVHWASTRPSLQQ
jgi:hypothetical protein